MGALSPPVTLHNNPPFHLHLRLSHITHTAGPMHHPCWTTCSSPPLPAVRDTEHGAPLATQAPRTTYLFSWTSPTPLSPYSMPARAPLESSIPNLFSPSPQAPLPLPNMRPLPPWDPFLIASFTA